MLDFEEALERGLNEAGTLATAEGLKQFDTDGSPITVGPVKFTSKGQVENAPGPGVTRTCSGRSRTSRTSRGRVGWTTPARVAAKEPIGSGVTEAACKVIVKQRLCGSGMKWTEGGSAVVLSLRTLSYTPERWGQFWAKIDRWGFPVAA